MEKFPGVIVEQIYTGCLAQAAYYIESGGEAVVIDPMRETAPYLERAQKSGARIKYVFETHFHADFVSGHVDLARESGASIVYGPGAAPVFAAHVAHDGEEFTLGSVRLRLLHTPGHTMESSCYLLIDSEEREVALFTGDTLFLGDVGRPDLAVKSDLTKEQLADKLFHSLQTKIMPLADELIIYPGHGAGSACGKHLSRETMDTLGHQKAVNVALAQTTEEDFRREVLTGIQPPPAYFPMNARLNREGYAAIDQVMGQGETALTPGDFENIANATGALVVDTRSPADFHKAFIPNAVSIGLDGSFANWAGSLLGDPRQPLLLVCDAGRESEAVARLARVGYENVLGHLEGGFEAWTAEGRDTDSLESVSAEEFLRRLAVQRAADGDLFVLDVRKPTEYAAGKVEGAVNIPLDGLNANMSALPRDVRIHIHCASGYRSMIAASILKARGFDEVTNVEGGYNAIARLAAAVENEARATDATVQETACCSTQGAC
jgi:hydroxyacylglutathione hydrolase